MMTIFLEIFDKKISIFTTSKNYIYTLQRFLFTSRKMINTFWYNSILYYTFKLQ